MDKNTIWAIVLSTLVIIATFAVSPLIFKNKNVEEQTSIEQVAESEEKTEENKEIPEISEVIKSEENKTEDLSEKIDEEIITINTNIAEIKITNKGGDILSYKLKNHIDTDTKDGIEISDNVSNFNRTCSLALGPVDTKILNDNFKVTKENDYSYLFTKNVNIGGKKYILGKRYTFKDDEYVFKLDILIHSENGEGLDNEGVAYTIRTSPQIGPHYNPKQDRYEYRQFVAYNGSKYKKINLGTGQSLKRYDKDFIWTGIGGKYFIELIIPSQSEIINSGFYTTVVDNNDYSNAQALIERKAFKESDVSDTYYMYFGPRNEKDLKRYNVSENNGWGIGGKKITQCLQTSGWLSWLENILKWCLELLHKFIKNWGICIILLTILLKLAMFPLSKKQSMSTLKMQKVQPQIQKIQEKYKDDQQRMQQELSKIYQEAGYNPMSGCLPMIFQFLILFAMYNLFNNYFEFRGSMFIPHWIEDLSKGDSVVTFGFNIPLLGNQLRILPIIYVATQLLYGKITQYGGATQGKSGASMKFMTYGMPIIFFFLFYNAPSGLLLYWTVSNAFQMIQQVFINKMMAKKQSEMKNEVADSSKKLPLKAKAKIKKAKNINKKI